jgi:S-adenosylmethionine hydrolase
MKIITFLSDFGGNDWFVAAVKGEIHKIIRDVHIVDITHNIVPFDIHGAAFLLSAVYRNFSEGTVHLAVVDPGVGGERKPIIIDASGYYFVGPDNGLFSFVDRSGAKVYEIASSSEVSATFHARDVFGPAAARLVNGMKPKTLGREITEYVHFETPKATKERGLISCEIVYIDHFGNCITNIPNDWEIKTVQLAGRSISVKKGYGDGKANEIICVKGSIGHYEIAVNRGNACNLLQARIGTPAKAL